MWYQKSDTRLAFALVIISIVPYLYLFTQIQILGDFWSAFGNIAGLIGATAMLWQALLGVRYIARRLSPDYAGVIKLHTFLGIYGAFFILIHPLLVMMSYGESLAYLILPDLSTEHAVHVTMGRGALVLFFLVWISSALARRGLSYRTWLSVHYLSYPLLLLSYIHALDIGTFLSAYPALMAYWIGQLAIFVMLVAYRIAKATGLGVPRYTLASRQDHADGIVEYVLTPQGRHVVPSVGQYVYLKAGITSESHPYSVMRYDQTTGTLTFGIKTVGRSTKQLSELALGSTILVDGPYGIFTQEGHTDEPKVVIAGGIGVTPFVQLIEQFGTRDTYMFYANRQLDDAVCRDEFISELGERYTDVISRSDAPSTLDKYAVAGRFDQQILTERVPADILRQAKYFVCGSPRFMMGVYATLAACGIPQERVYSEEFSF